MVHALRNRWNDASFHGDSALSQAVHAARLVGAEPGLVLFGGGNTSVKTREEGREVLRVKGSGADLAFVREEDYTPLALEPVRALLDRDLPDNAAMYAALAPLVLDARAPRPSIETLMHAGLPAPHVIHTHAAAVLAIANTQDAARHLQATFGAMAPLAPYRHSGLALARACVATWQAADPREAIGLVLAHHGALVCGRDAREAYERMLELANRAECYLDSQGASPSCCPAHEAVEGDMACLMAIARVRHEACRQAGRKLVAVRRDGGFIGAFARRDDVATLTSHGPSTPGHTIWTKRIPLIGRDVGDYSRLYLAYLGGATEVDAAPRVVLDPQFGMLALGVTARHAGMAAEVFMHDAAIMARADTLGGYATIGAGLMRAAELEYAGFEARVARESPHAGEVHVIDHACERGESIASLLAAGAAVAGIDANVAVERLSDHPAYLGIAAPRPSHAACTAIVHAFGGIDALQVGTEWRHALTPFLANAHE